MAIRNLEERLKIWAEHGLISNDQGRKILDFENSQVSRSWIIYGVAAIGVVAIAAGLISIIAANWAEITPTQKLTTYFLWQGLLGLAFYQQSERPGLKREILLSLFSLSFLGGIGLVGQIYNIESDAWQGLAFWLTLILPAAILAQTRALPMLWIIALFITLELWKWNHVTWYYGSRSYDMGDLNHQHLTVRLLAMAGMYAVMCIGGLHPYIKNTGVKNLTESFAKVGWLVLMLFYVPYINFLWVSFDRLTPFTLIEIAPAFTLALIAAAIYLLRPKPVSTNNSDYILGLTIFLTGILTVIPLLIVNLRSDFLGALICIGLFALGATAAARINARRIFNALSFLIAGRFILVYFEVFGSLAATGLGLIISGMLILGTLWGWYKFKHKIELALRGSR
jgi:uncharacterized membrane protein